LNIFIVIVFDFQKSIFVFAICATSPIVYMDTCGAICFCLTRTQVLCNAFVYFMGSYECAGTASCYEYV